jgi:hypothetical protein
LLLLCCVQIFDSKRKAYKYLFASTYNGGGKNRLVGSRHSGSDAADVRFVSGCQSLHLFSTLFRHFVFLYFFFCFFTFLGSSGWAAPCVWFTDRTRRKRKIPFTMYIIFQFGFVCVCAVCSLCEFVLLLFHHFPMFFPPFLFVFSFARITKDFF